MINGFWNFQSMNSWWFIISWVRFVLTL